MRTIRRFLTPLLISIIGFSLFSCSPNSDNGDVGEYAAELQYGFEFSESNPLPPDFCAFKSDRTQFDIDDVLVTFYFGSCGIEENDEGGKSIPSFDIYFTDENDNMLYLVRHVEENYISNKYKVSLEFNPETKKLQAKYSYSEKVFLPSQLFREEKGRIGFRLGGINENSVEQKYYIFNGVWIYYKVDGTKVTLSSCNL